jgi:hypothetical protein
MKKMKIENLSSGEVANAPSELQQRQQDAEKFIRAKCVRFELPESSTESLCEDIRSAVELYDGSDFYDWLSEACSPAVEAVRSQLDTAINKEFEANWKHLKTAARRSVLSLLFTGQIQFDDGDIDELVTDTGTAFFHWRTHGVARTNGVNRRSEGTAIKGIPVWSSDIVYHEECTAGCKCKPPVKKFCAVHVVHQIAAALTKQFIRSRKPPRDYTESNRQQKAEKEAVKRGEDPLALRTKNKKERTGTKTFAQMLRLGLKAKRPIEQMAFEKEVLDMSEDEDESYDHRTAPSLKPGAGLMLALAERTPDSKIVGMDTGEVRDAKRKLHHPAQSITHGERYSSVIDGWRFENRGMPIRHVSAEEFDRLVNHPPITWLASDNITSCGKHSYTWEVNTDLPTEGSGSGSEGDGFAVKREQREQRHDDRASERAEKKRTIKPRTNYLYHRELMRVRLVRHLKNGSETWVLRRKDTAPVLVQTVDLAPEPWPKLPKRVKKVA